MATGQIGIPRGSPAAKGPPLASSGIIITPQPAASPSAVPPIFLPAESATTPIPVAESPMLTPTASRPSADHVPEGQTEPVPILMYHHVRPDPGLGDPIGQNLSVNPETFDAQMSYLVTNGYTPMTMGELADVRARRRLPLPPRPIVLTFDVGYRDFYTHAWPVLRRYGIKATSFIITGWVDQPRYLTWQMIDEMASSGLVEFGSHTRDHKELPRLDDDHAGDEIIESKRALEAHLGQSVRSFYYPAGRFTPRDAALVWKAGYEIAVTTQPGFASAEEDSLLLPRVRIDGPTTMPRFAAIFE